MIRPFSRIAAAGLGVLLYIGFFPVVARPELTVQPLWATNPATASVSASVPGPFLPLEFDQGFAFLSLGGEVAYRGRTANGVALSPEFFINYARNSQQLVVQLPDGSFAESIPDSGYPYVRRGRVFVIAEQAGRLIEWRDGERVLDVLIPAPILDIDAAERLVAVAPAAGGVILLAPGANGPVRFDVDRPTASGREVVRAVSLAADASRLAVIASGGGAQQSTVTVYTIEDGRGRPVVRRSIPSTSVPTPLVRLSADGSRLLYHAAGELVVLDPDSGEEYRVELADRPIASIEPDGSPGTIVLAQGEESDPARGFARSARLLFVAGGGLVPMNVGWFAHQSFLSSSERIIVLRVNERYLGFEMVVR